MHDDTLSKLLSSIVVPDDYTKEQDRLRSIDGIGELLGKKLVVPKDIFIKNTLLSLILSTSGKDISGGSIISGSCNLEPSILDICPIILPKEYIKEKREEKILQENIFYSLFPHTRKIEEEIIRDILHKTLNTEDVLSQIAEEKKFRDTIFSSLYSIVPNVTEVVEEVKDIPKFDVTFEYNKSKPFGKVDITTLATFEIEKLEDVNSKLLVSNIRKIFYEIDNKHQEEYEKWYSGDYGSVNLYVPFVAISGEPISGGPFLVDGSGNIYHFLVDNLGNRLIWQ